jgi:hypothetical protein
MQTSAKYCRQIAPAQRVKIYAYANNHYAGHGFTLRDEGPATVALFQKFSEKE